jgi:hypothetical protein
VDELLAKLEDAVRTAVRSAVGEQADDGAEVAHRSAIPHRTAKIGANVSSNPQQVATNDIESGTSGLAKELGKAVLWALVEDALRLLAKNAKPLVAEAAQAVAVTADRLGVFAAQKLQAAAKTVRNEAPHPESLCLGAGYLFSDMNPQRKKMIGSLKPKTRTQMTKR